MRRILFVTLGTLALASCASSASSHEPTAPAKKAPPERQPGMHGGGMAAMCPMEVAGTSAAASDIAGGAAMTFTTSGDVAELRRRVAHMARMHHRHSGEGRGHAGMGGDGHKHMGGDAHKHTGGDGHKHMGGDAHKHMGGDAHRSKMKKRGMMMMPPASARVEDIEGGARVILTPKNPADLPKLRKHARHMADRMANGGCPMMKKSGAEKKGAKDVGHDTHHPAPTDGRSHDHDK